jgi:hypothetical protein
LNDLATIVVEIDNQQYERRKEKQANRQGTTYNPNWNRNQSNNNRSQQNNNRNQANQGRQRQNDTSYGTHAGPMTIGATRFDKSKLTCWNCGKKGHKEHECRNPVKTNQKYKPVPEGKNTRRTNSQESEPQMAIRTSKRIAMTRTGYDTTTYAQHIDSHPETLIQQPRDPFQGYKEIMDKYYPEGDQPIKGYRADLEPGYQAAKQQRKEQETARRRD